VRIGTIGLGTIGATMAQRLRRDGHEVVGSDVQPFRFASRQNEAPTMKAVAVLRDRFGGHGVRS
jgi:6-phosphogluconate dehydrogenase (decarboxylating)